VGVVVVVGGTGLRVVWGGAWGGEVNRGGETERGRGGALKVVL